jgi:hypothetical protein
MVKTGTGDEVRSMEIKKVGTGVCDGGFDTIVSGIA